MLLLLNQFTRFAVFMKKVFDKTDFADGDRHIIKYARDEHHAILTVRANAFFSQLACVSLVRRTNEIIQRQLYMFF